MYLVDNHPTIKAPSATRDITPSRLFLVHGTTVKNYNKIMKDGVLKVNNFKWKTTNNNEEGIFFQLMAEEFEKEYTWAEKRIKLNDMPPAWYHAEPKGHIIRRQPIGLSFKYLGS